MEFNSKEDLKHLIHEKLSPIIGSTCALFDLPYYKNIGDVLIWQGELDFLKEESKEIVYSCSEKSCTYPNLSKEVSILFQGGGNLGDLYINHTNFLISLIKRYPENLFLVFPQTIYFEDKSIEQNVFSEIKKHKNLYLCCRDNTSFEIASKYLADRCILIPDMAFCINPKVLEKEIYSPRVYNSLFIRRNDIEKSKTLHLNRDFNLISDWPSFEGKYTKGIIVNTIYDRLVPLLNSSYLKRSWDKFSIESFLKDMINLGVNFISPYDNVASERLHGAILSILLGKNVTILDNNYGKNSNFFKTWLCNLPNVELYASR